MFDREGVPVRFYLDARVHFREETKGFVKKREAT